MRLTTFQVGEIAHVWRGAGGRVVVPEEVEIVKISPNIITARDAKGQMLRFRVRDHMLVGLRFGPELKKLDRALAERQSEARAQEQMRQEIFWMNIHLQELGRWSDDADVLRGIAAAYRSFLRRAIALGATVPDNLRDWLAAEPEGEAKQ